MPHPSFYSGLTALTGVMDELSERSYLQRAVWRGDISARIRSAYKDLENAKETFKVSIFLLSFFHPTESDL